jgi:carbon storage regulator CsrA
VLVLSRKKDEDILIQTPEGRVVTIRVVEIVGDKVRLGFEAEKCVSIVRTELISPKEVKHGLERPANGGPLHPAP